MSRSDIWQRGDRVPLAEVVEDLYADVEDPAEIIDRHRQSQRIVQCVRTLKPNEQRVLCERFGGNEGDGRTYEEIGRDMDRTKQTVQIIQRRALRRLRHPARILFLLGHSPFMGPVSSKEENTWDGRRQRALEGLERLATLRRHGITRVELCRVLRCASSTLERLESRGMPSAVGSWNTPYTYDRKAVYEWLRKWIIDEEMTIGVATDPAKSIPKVDIQCPTKTCGRHFMVRHESDAFPRHSCGRHPGMQCRYNGCKACRARTIPTDLRRRMVIPEERQRPGHEDFRLWSVVLRSGSRVAPTLGMILELYGSVYRAVFPLVWEDDLGPKSDCYIEALRWAPWPTLDDPTALFEIYFACSPCGILHKGPAIALPVRFAYYRQYAAKHLGKGILAVDETLRQLADDHAACRPEPVWNIVPGPEIPPHWDRK